MTQTYLVGIALLALIYQTQAAYKLCAFPEMDNVSCDRVEEGNSNVTCVRVTDSVDCSDKLKNGQADFAVYTGDEAVLAGKFVSDYVNIIGEARYKKRFTDPNYEDLVVVVRNPFSGSFVDLVGKGYCHPGVGISYKVSDKILKSFEQIVVPSKDCTQKYAVAEQDIRDLELFFGPSCRPGKWALDDSLDNKLKRRYRNMCRLCDSPSQCSNGLLNNGLEKGALDCLTISGGDVAFVSLEAVNSYFGLTKGAATASPADYSFLCPNQTVMPLNSNMRPCIWASQPWNVLVSRKSISGELQDKLNIWLSDTKKEGSEKWQNHLKKLLLKDWGTFVSRSLNSSLPVSQYINRGVADRDVNRCRRQIDWCTTHDLEREKCKWLQAATETLGIRPHIECLNKTSDKWSCLQKVSDGTADLVSIPTDDGFIARKVYSLSTVFYEDNLLNGNYKIIAIIKNQNTAVKGFSDLKNKRACFPEYNGLAWIAFANTVRQQGLLGKRCPENFFTEACAPGAGLASFSASGRKAPSQLCNICPSNSDGRGSCSPSLSRKDRTLRALQCLDNSGDVAFINLRAVTSGDRNAQLDSSIDPTKYQVLCSNGSIVSGLSVDDNCALAMGVQGEIVGRRSRSSVEENDNKELLLQLNQWFGTSEETSRNIISVYGKFKGQGGLLFEDRTISLVDPDDEHYDYINNYKSLLGNTTQTCSGGNSILHSITSIVLLISSLSAFLFS
uniref:Transferrin n=1 Tax=Lygus hesperus TaxID=30085 RepID=A0A0A9XS57_LYGHE